MDPRLPLTGERDPRSVVSEERIREVVAAFYERVRGDDLIGPVFAARIHDWPRHLDLLCDFWSSALNRTGRYRGRPIPKHLGLGLELSHFERWLMLFRRTCEEICMPQETAAFTAMAERMGASMKFMLRLEPG